MVFGVQNFPRLPDRKPDVTPTFVFDFNPRPHYLSTQTMMFATRAKINFRPLKPSMEELLMYDWQAFFSVLDTFEHMEEVELFFAEQEHCDTLTKKHRKLLSVNDKSRVRPHRRYLYTLANHGVRSTWSQ